MDISTGGYMTFTANWELYRLAKLKRFVPLTKAEALQKGSGVHLYAKSYGAGIAVSPEEIKTAKITGEEMSKAAGLWEYLKQHLEEQDYKILAVEKKYKIPVPGTQHNLIGVYDAVASNGIDEFVLEYKTAGRQRNSREFPIEWKCNTQAESVILGARSHGFNVERGEAVYVQDGSPPKIHVIPFERSQYQLDYYLRSVGQVCDVIEFLIQKYGIDEPWPHLIHSKWFSDISGKCNNGWCENQLICGMTHNDEVPAGFEIEETQDFSDETLAKQFETEVIKIESAPIHSLDDDAGVKIRKWDEEDV